MAQTGTKAAGRKTVKVDGFDLRETPGGEWEVFDTASGHAIRIFGNPLTSLSRDEARGAIRLLQAAAVKPDQPR